ncbi:NACHT domain-containing protein [Edwardsiella piscicida]|uniref:phosphorylase family protein n=2 Tax=Edwardsiella piscicida TaxID=1263550 RepID=UPI000D52544A|nr:NACHT domain-containing protein [Edwardsiella piscicida]UCQ20731.1 NACHT domain-containing protein [Edwardsiella piscicida]
MIPRQEKNPLLICITENEYLAIKNKFTRLSSETYQSIVIEHGLVSNRPFYLVRFMEMGARGRDTLSHKLPLLLDYLQPSLVIELGICFGIKDNFNLGDVAICRYSIDYELEKINENNIEYRSKSTQSDGDIHSKLMNFATNEKYDFKIVSGTFACGDKIVNSQNFKDRISKAIPEALCGDMESYLVGVCCESSRVPWIVIKSSSDDGVNKDDLHQKIAADNCVTFFSDFIEKYDDLENYYDDNFDVDFKKNIDYELISKEIFNNNNDIAITKITNSRNSYQIHQHPDMGNAWIILYISKAHSIPETIRTTIKNISKLSRVDICIATNNEISNSNKKTYEEILVKAGCEKYFIAEIGKFIYKRVVERNTSMTLIQPPENYVDQVVYFNDKPSLPGSKYARSFIKSTDDNRSRINPISIILGQGGIGKTTFCLSLAKMINFAPKTEKRIFLITKMDIINNFSGETIDSISKLYMEYTRNISGQVRPISHETFSLALSCGSIILMIDGIDEIESALGDKFKMELFLESINQLNEYLKSCRVLITSRDSNASRFLSIENSELLYIKGFSASDIEEYTSNDEPEIRKRIKEFAQRIKNNNNLVNPYLLHVIRQFHFEKVKESWESQEIQTSQLLLNDPFDYCLARALMREIEKQSLHISVDDYYELLNEIVVEKENKMDSEYFEDYIEIYLQKNGSTTPPRREPYLKFFLLEENDLITSVSHTEYAAHIMLNKLFSIFSNLSHNTQNDIRLVRSIFGGPKSESYGLRGRLCKRLINQDINEFDFEKKITILLNGIKGDGIGITTIRAIHELHMLAFEYWNPKTATERREILGKLHNENKIHGLCILSDCPSIDFNDCVIENGIFRHFRSFFNCKINENTKFINCEFKDCTGNFKRENIRSDVFIDCKLDDGMRHLLYAGDDKRGGIASKAKSDVKQVLKSMRQGLGFLSMSTNKIKAQSNLVSGKSYEEFLGTMCDIGVLEFDNGLYSVAKNVELDAVALCEEGHAQGKITILIKELSEK